MALAMQDVKALIDKLDKENALSLDEWEELIRGRCDQVAEYAAEIVAFAGITGRLNVTA